MKRFPYLSIPILLLALSPILQAAPPKLSLPTEVKPEGQYVIVQPDTDAVSIVYVGLDGLEPFPPALLADKRLFALDTFGKKPGAYRFVAVAASSTGEQTRASFTLLIGSPMPEPPPALPVTPPTKPTDPQPPPAKPPEAPTRKLFFLIIRQAGVAASPEHVKAINLPGWKALRSSGHSVLEIDDKELLEKYRVQLNDWNGKPSLLVLRNRVDGKGSEIARQVSLMPQSDAEIKTAYEEASK